MRRREFIRFVGGATAWPLAARGQPASPRVVGLLSPNSTSADAPRLMALRQGLRETGWVERQNVMLEYRGAAGHYDQLPILAGDLVRHQVNIIVTLGGIPAARAAKAATSAIPIVFYVGGDPVENGLISSLNRPGGNLTGVSTLNTELAPKRLELLHEILPNRVMVAALLNPTNPLHEPVSKELEAAARTTGLDVQIFYASSEREIDAAFVALRERGAKALVIGNDPFFNSRVEQIATLALGDHVPTIYQYREFAAAGGLMSYGGSVSDLFHQIGIYAGRILNGENPADLPVQQLTKVELIINLRTAKALGITMPISLLGRADEVIE
jgi:putative ABC transport system substrate-binding protein